MSSVSRVCVIGAGAAGLCAARHCLGLSALKKLVVYEQTEFLGGTWVYTDQVGLDVYGLPIHSSMYKHMKTNLPKEVMGFPEFPFPNTQPDSFLTHATVLEYLNDYAFHYGLIQYIKFRHCVLSVDEGTSGWEVTAKDLKTCQQETIEFDSIFVCNGHYCAPNIPKVPGLGDFKGAVLHSHNYREPEPFRDRRVACLGAGPSGIDIAIELAAVCSQVFLCHKGPTIESTLPSNLIQTSAFEEFNEDGVLLQNGEIIKLDGVVFCTGYNYSFPFLNWNTLPLSLDQKTDRLSPLYQHLVHIDHPTLFFVGICNTICPFPHFDMQVRFAIAVLSNNCNLPTKEEMYEWEEEDKKYRATELKLSRRTSGHFLGPLQWPYIEKMAKLGNFENPVPPVIEKLYQEIHRSRIRNLTTYKREVYRLVDKENYVHIGVFHDT